MIFIEEMVFTREMVCSPAALATNKMRGSAGQGAAATTAGASSTSLAETPIMKKGAMVYVDRQRRLKKVEGASKGRGVA